MRVFLGIVLCLLCLSCNNSQQGNDQPLFYLIPSSASGIDFENQIQSTDNFNIVEYLYFYNGGGVATGDINNDGLTDIYFTSNQSKNALYLNKGDFRFENITASAGVGGEGDWTTGVTMADVNGDGWIDIYVSHVSDYKGLDGANELFINNGDLTFDNRASEMGLDFRGFSTQAVFFDYDKDSDLDMYLLNHSVHSVGSYGEAILRKEIDLKSGDRLYQNQLAQGLMVFKDVTLESGIYSSKIGYGLGVEVADINDDGWDDIYVSNDFHESDYLYINNHDGSFREQLEDMIGHTSRYSMGNDIGDLNNDGRLDIITTDMLPKNPTILLKSGAEDRLEVNDIKLAYGYGPQLARNTMQVSRGNGLFSDIALMTKTFATDWSWSPLIVDLDNDGLKDVYVTNGIYKRPNDMDYIQYISNMEDIRYTNTTEGKVNEEMINRMPSVKIPNEVFKGEGNYSWKSIGEVWGLNQLSYSNGSSYADLDNDGDLDLVVNNVNQPCFLYRNNASDILKNNYLQIELKGSGFNTESLGSKILLRDDGSMNYITTTRGFQSAVDSRLTIGIGKKVKIDTLEIFWSSGKHQLLTNVAVNKMLTIDEPDSDTPTMPDTTVTILTPSANLLAFKHKENLQYKDNNFEYVLPYRLSTLGPAFSAGDINGDKLVDFFVGGASGQSAKLFIQQSDLSFKESRQPAFELDEFYEDVKSLFVDVDNDGDMDIIVLSGGYQFNDGDRLLADRLYLNNNGIFGRSIILPSGNKNSSSVDAVDFDSDGDMDLAIGSNAIRGSYGVNSGGVILVNNGAGEFENNTRTLAPEFTDLGMITDLAWSDFDLDGDMDLAIVGHWMPITLLINSNGVLTEKYEIPGSSGFWNCVSLFDCDNDGDVDILAGNIGLNNKFEATSEFPLKLFVADFDSNGTSDPIIMHHQQDRYIPIFTKDEIEKQVVSIKKRYNTYQEYASKVNGINDLFDDAVVKEAIKKNIVEVRSMLYENERGTFMGVPLPTEMQIAPINSIVVDNFNEDGIPDILTSGNNYWMHVNLGRLDGDYGSIAFGTKNGSFKYVNNRQSGLKLKGQVSESVKLTIGSSKYFAFAINNDSVRFYHQETEYEK